MFCGIQTESRASWEGIITAVVEGSKSKATIGLIAAGTYHAVKQFVLEPKKESREYAIECNKQRLEIWREKDEICKQLKSGEIEKDAYKMLNSCLNSIAEKLDSKQVIRGSGITEELRFMKEQIEELGTKSEALGTDIKKLTGEKQIKATVSQEYAIGNDKG